MKLSAVGGILSAVQVCRVLLNVWLVLVRWPVSSIPPTVKMLPLPSSIVVGYQRAVAMAGCATYFWVTGSNRYVFFDPVFELLVVGLG